MSGFLKQYKNKVGTHVLISSNDLCFNKRNQSNRTLLSALVEVAQNTIVLFFQTPSHMMQILRHLDTSMLAFIAVRLIWIIYTKHRDVRVRLTSLSSISRCPSVAYRRSVSVKNLSSNESLYTLKNREQSKPTVTHSKRTWWRKFCNRQEDGVWRVPVNQTACPGGSWADFGLLFLHSAPVRSAPKYHPLCASGLRCRSLYGCETVPTQCPCRGNRTSTSCHQWTTPEGEFDWTETRYQMEGSNEFCKT